MSLMINAYPPPPVQQVWGTTRYGNVQWPVMITAIELSGWAMTAQGPLPLQRVRLDPSQTHLHGNCQCPMTWQTFPTPARPLFLNA